MKVLLTIPMEIQDNLVKACEPVSSKYRMLKNGLIETEGNGTKVFRVLCEPEQAKKFLTWANKQRPGSATRIIVSQES